MERLLLEATALSPRIEFDRDRGVFLLQGKSLPEDVKSFYSPALKWLDEYCKQPNDVTVLTLDFEYINTASSKMILLLLSKIKELHSKGYEVKVIWKFPENDAEMEEAGEEYADLLKIPFELIPKAIY